MVQVARVQPIKRQDVLLAALGQLPEDVQAVIVGGVSEGVDQTYDERLRADAPPGRVTFTGGLPAGEVRAWYGRAAVAVNLSPVGLFDKAALESMAAGTPTIVTNAAFADLLGAWRDLLLIDGDLTPERLAERIAAVLALPDDQRAAMGDTLRENVVAAHSLDALMPRLVRTLGR